MTLAAAGCHGDPQQWSLWHGRGPQRHHALLHRQGSRFRRQQNAVRKQNSELRRNPGR